MRFAFFTRSALFAAILLAVSGAAHAQVRVAITIAPPVLPVYEQPICPGDGYIWTPGYWAYDYDDSDYYWVPGTWVLAPEVGFLWTPPYWGWDGAGFAFYDGYWGPVVEFYGGINYGFGYFGHGYEGGRWEGGHFFYNTAINHVDVNAIHNVYNTRVEVRNDTHVSYNGHGGIEARPTSQEEAAAHERHVGPIAAQTEHVQAARSDPQQRASVNRGAPAVAATPKPGAFKDSGVVRGGGSGARNNAPALTENTTSRPAVHPNDLPAMERPAAPSTGNAKQNQKYQQQQEKLQAKQQQDRQNLQQKQDQEHQQLARQKANETKTQQVEQRHQQQTQQLQQRHTQQTQQLQQRQQPPASHPTEAKPAR
jgi:WXXGXW repeat (2 copies)